MRKIRVLMVVAVLVVAATVSGVAQAQDETPRWGGAAVAERLIGWIEGLWTAVAGSQADPVAPGDGDGTTAAPPEVPGIATTSDDPSTQTEVYPEFDPDG